MLVFNFSGTFFCVRVRMHKDEKTNAKLSGAYAGLVRKDGDRPET